MTAPSAETRRYRILEVLGKGGFGTVYRAELQASGGFTKVVALKVLNSDIEGTHEFVRRLRDEARMLGLLRHRAIVQVDGLVLLDGRWTVVMEYVEGVSLSRLVDHGPVPVGVALEIVEDVAGALYAAFERPNKDGEPLRLLHRDIKPANVQLTAGGEVKLLDLGVARANFGEREAETRSLIFGSVNYMAPERLDFEDSHAGDVYALGIVFYELVTAQPLGKASVNPRRHTERIDEAIHTLSGYCGNPDVHDLVRTALSYEPKERPTARDFERTVRELRRTFDTPWLKDWAEDVVPSLLAHKAEDSDDLTGQVLTEATDAIEVPGAGGSVTLDEFTPPPLHVPSSAAAEVPPPLPSDALEPPPLPEPEARPEPGPPAPSADARSRPRTPRGGRRPPPRRSPQRPRRRSGIGTVLAVIGGTLLVIAGVVGLVVAVMFVVGGLGVAAVWPSLERESVISSFDDIDTTLVLVGGDPNAETLRKALDGVRYGPDLDNVSLWEVSTLAVAVDNAVLDGSVSDRERDDLLVQVAGIAAD